MIYNIRVIPNAGRNLVKNEEGRLKVYLTAPAIEGRANEALIAVMADQIYKNGIRPCHVIDNFHDFLEDPV